MQNASTLLSALRYEDPDGVEIEDATVSGSSAMVFVDTSEVTDAEAEYICDYTLDLSRELYEEGAWEGDSGMAGSLIEVEVKGRASFFNKASCSLGDP